MKLSRTIIPEDSLLHSWLDKWSHSEVFISWQILTGLAIIGVILRRNVCSLEGSVGRIWPNTSVLLVGPSGSGKDTIINPSCNLLKNLGGQYVVGRTLEAVKESLTQMGDPAIGYINASELADFLGCKDYQAGLVQTLTDILSGNKEEIDVSLKSDIVKGISRKIYNPTLTMFAGSTAEWLQNMMPDGTMDGGFLPRFVIAAEWSKKEEGIRLIAHPGKYDSPEQRMIVEGGEKIFVAGIRDLVGRMAEIPVKYLPHTMSETHGDDDAEGWYNNWYENRHKGFSPLLQAYASRSSGLLRRLAMLMAVSRGHINWIEEADYHFAEAIIQHAADRLEKAVVPQSKEVKVGFDILDLLPQTYPTILRTLSPKHQSVWVKRGIQYLIETEQIHQQKDGKFDSTCTTNEQG